MNANDVIDSYVRDVAARLPRAKRNDVAFELRALLADELAARAQTEGRAPDKAMALDLLKGFGRPAEAARRYHEPSAIIEPSDTHHFVIWTLGGFVTFGVLAALGADEVNGDLFLQWLGILVIFFALAGWLRRRKPGAFGWKPKGDPDAMPRSLSLLAMVATLIFPVFMYAAPQTFVHTMFLGVVQSDGVALTDAFRDSPQRLATLALLVASVVIYAGVAIQGSYRPWSRWASIVVMGGLGGFAVMQATPMMSVDGQTFEVFKSARANTVAAPFFGLVGAMFILGVLYELYREWARIRPAPALEGRPAA